MTEEAATVFVVDDDASILKSLKRLIKSEGHDVKTFTGAREFLEQGSCKGPGCLVLDVRMPGIDGLKLQEKMAEAGLSMPIVFITGYGNIPMSVKAMKAGAVDFLEKPCDGPALLTAIRRAIERHKTSLITESEKTDIERRVNSLTRREREVFALVVTGMLNKQAACELGITEKTIKVHRGQVMRKMGAESIADLVRMAQKIGFPP